jgi:hypothetical protein
LLPSKLTSALYTTDVNRNTIILTSIFIQLPPLKD